MPAADVQERRVDALFGHLFSMHERHPEGVAVQGQGRIDVLHGHAHVVDHLKHGG